MLRKPTFGVTHRFQPISRFGASRGSVGWDARRQSFGRGGNDVQEAVAEVIRKGNPEQQAHGLWVLARLDALNERSLQEASTSQHELVRSHTMRILEQREALSKVLRQLVVDALSDQSPHVQRAAASALCQHQVMGSVPELLEARHAVDEQDSHLTHVLRMAIRHQLRNTEEWEPFAASPSDN